MRPIATDVVCSVVWTAWSVCLSIYLCVGHTDAPSKTAEPIEMPFGGWLGWAQGTMIRWGKYPPGRDNFGELSGPLKSMGRQCCGICRKLNHSMINNGMTGACNAPDWSVSRYIVSSEESAPAMRPFVKILWLFLLFLVQCGRLRWLSITSITS